MAVRPVDRIPLARRSRRADRRGLTLVEIIVVMGIIAVVSGVAIAGSMQLPSARLRRSATMISSAIKVAYTRATATSRDVRLVMDLDHQRIWLEASQRPMLVKSSDVDATGGAEAVTKAEQAALVAGEKIVKGPVIPKPQFTPIDTYGFGDTDSEEPATARGKALQRGITFRSVQTGHDDTARTSGRAYLYFWPGGRTERAAIQVRIGESIEESRTLTLAVSPLTGQVTIKGGAVELQIPTEDDINSRLDFGF